MNGRAARLGTELEKLRRVKVDLASIHAAWAAAAPELSGRYESRPALADDLEALASAGVVVLPGAGSWEKTAQPPLPRFVRVPSARRAPREAPWRDRVWHPELAWAASLATLSPRLHQALVALDDWMAATDGQAPAPVPLRFRSAEIFSDEKLLEELAASSTLFGPGRLSLERLAVQRRPQPLALVRVSDGPDVLVVENSDPFWACRDLLAAIAGPVGRVGFGAGNAFVATVAALADEAVPVRRLFYWGDLDPKGLDIALDASVTAGRCGLPALEPAVPLWAAMGLFDPSSPGRYRWTGRASGWLGEELWAATKAVRAAGGRVAQERVALAGISEGLARMSNRLEGRDGGPIVNSHLLQHRNSH